MANEPVQQKSTSWLSPSNCTCTWDTLLMIVILGVAIYLLARSVFDVIFWIVFSICIVCAVIYTYYKCCMNSNGNRKEANEGYSSIPNGPNDNI